MHDPVPEVPEVAGDGRGHLTPPPLHSYADIARAGASGLALPTDLPGATVKATPLNATAVG